MIALDAMGGDYAPRETVLGALYAARRGISVMVVGDQVRMEQLLHEADALWQKYPLTLVHADNVIGMGEAPTRSVVQKNDSSLLVAIDAVKQGKATAVVSAGNSGAALVAGVLLLGRTPGLARPAIASFLPSKKDSFLCLDLGANTDCKPEYLYQFALLGHAYVQQAKGIARPRIGLLSNGHEEKKGSLLVKQAYALLAQEPRIQFVGNIESRDVFDGSVDVVVCDGFVGNVFLKAVQGAISAFEHFVKQEGRKTWFGSFCLGLSRSLFKAVQKKIDYTKQGQALLCGLQYPFIIAHGCGRAEAIERAIMHAQSLVDQRAIETINDCYGALIQQSSAGCRVAETYEQLR